MQINTMTNQQPSLNGAAYSSDRDKKEKEQMVQDFYSVPDIQKRVRNLVNKSTRLNLNLDELRKFNGSLAEFVVRHPIDAITLFEKQLQLEIDKNTGMDGSGKGQQSKAAVREEAAFPRKVQTFHVNFEGNFGHNFVTPRGLKAPLLNQMVAV